MEGLKELLGDELYAQVAAKLGDREVIVHARGEKFVHDDGKMIPKHRLDEVIAKRDELAKLVEKADKDLEALKLAAAGNQTLTHQIEALQDAGKKAKEEAEKRETELRKGFALREALMGAGVMDAEARDLLALRFDASKIELDEKGHVKGFDDMLKPIKENKALAGMFGTERFSGPQHATGEPPSPVDLGPYGGKNPFAKATRNITLQVQITKTNPELAAKLKAAAGE